MSVDRTVGATSLVSLLGSWRPGGRAYEQLAGGIRRLVTDGRLPVQSQLPAERHMAKELGVSRNTVTAAYEVLRSEGFLASRRGSGTWTTLPDQPVPAGGGAAVPIDLTVAALPPPSDLHRHVREAAAELEGLALGHGYEPLGMPTLRAAIAADFTRRGLATTERQVLVTNGAMHALVLMFRALLRRGDTALVEIPTYPHALDALRDAQVRLVHLPLVAGSWDLEMMRSTFDRARPRLAYVVPDFHNPTGALISRAQRESLLHAAMRVDCHVVVDQTYLDLYLDGQTLPPMMAALVNDPRVVTVGSMSKAYWGGLRVGWIRASPTLVQRVSRIRAGQDMGGPVLEQLIAARLLDGSQRGLGVRRRVVAARRDSLESALAKSLPGWSWIHPGGGFSLWAELPAGLSSEQLATAALREGVRLAPGPRFGMPGTLDRYLRVPFTLPAAQLEDAVARLARAATRVTSGTGARRGPVYVA